MNFNPKRLENETFKSYKARRKNGNNLIKIHLRGRKVKRTKNEVSKIFK